jgi:hypothetical protein
MAACVAIANACPALDAERQRRQGNVQPEEVHPGEARFRQPVALPQAKPIKIKPK